jgi:ABC-type sulfate transport system permease component
MLSLVFAYGWTIVIAGCAVAAFLYLPAPFKTPVVGLLLIVLVGDVGYTAGLSKGVSQAHQASIVYQAQLDHRDLAIGVAQQKLADALTAQQEAHSETDAKVSTYEATLGTSRACPLSDGDRERLLDIK